MGVYVEGGSGSVYMINNLGLFLSQVRAGLGLQGVGGGKGALQGLWVSLGSSDVAYNGDTVTVRLPSGNCFHNKRVNRLLNPNDVADFHLVTTRHCFIRQH